MKIAICLPFAICLSFFLFRLPPPTSSETYVACPSLIRRGTTNLGLVVLAINAIGCAVPVFDFGRGGGGGIDFGRDAELELCTGGG